VVVVAPPSPQIVVAAQPSPVVMAPAAPVPVVRAAPIALPPRGTMIPAVIAVPPGHPAPFVYPACDPYVDSQQLRAALKGNPLHTDGRTLITIICNRAPNQLELISAVYANQFGHSLKHGIKDELKMQYNFRKLLTRRFRSAHEQKARALYKAVHHKGVVAVNDGRLIDCLAFTPNGEMPVLKAFVQQSTGEQLMALVDRHTTDVGNFRECLNILMSGTRDESPTINPNAIAQDVQSLYRASDAHKIGHDTQAFISVLCRHAPWYNAAVNAAYGSTHKHDLIRAIDKTSMTSNTKHVLIALCKQPYEYWADRLYFAMKGAGTDNKTMVYVLSFLERNELLQVVQLVHQRHPSHEFYKMLRSDLSGNYLHAALALCGQPF